MLLYQTQPTYMKGRTEKGQKCECTDTGKLHDWYTVWTPLDITMMLFICEVLGLLRY